MLIKKNIETMGTMKEMLSWMHEGEIEILDYGFYRSNVAGKLEVQFAINADSRVFTTWISQREIGGAAYEAGQVEQYSDNHVWIDYDNDVSKKTDRWFENDCEDTEALMIDCVKFQAKEALASMAKIAKECPGKFDLSNYNWMQLLVVWDLWAGRAILSKKWFAEVVRMVFTGTRVGEGLSPEAWKFAQLMREAFAAHKSKTPDANVVGRVFWLPNGEAKQTYIVRTVEQIAV